jgi:phosphopentomutase
VFYNYDSHIPLYFYGKGIKKGNVNRLSYMTDIAPTISTLLGIQMPSGNIGNPILEVLK